MTSLRGWPDQRKKSEVPAEHVTVAPVREWQNALDVVAHNAVQNIVTADVVEAGSTTTVINATGHSANKGDVIRFATGALAPRDVHVQSVTANTITLAEELPAAPSPGDTFDIGRFTYQTIAAGGATSTQVAFLRNGSNQIVTEDTVTPANNRPLPVKITDVTGDINITANDLNVQLAHDDATPDSVQIGDGTDVLAINADGSIGVRLSDGTDALAINGDGSVNVTDNGGSLTVDDGGGSLTVDGSVSVSNFPAVQPVDDNGGSLTVDDGGSTLSVDDGGSTISVDDNGGSLTVDGTVTQGTASATFQALGKILGTALTGTYATLATAAGDCKVVALLNRCDEPIQISLDGGVTTHFEFEPGESFALDLGANGLHFANGTVIQARHSGVAPTSGSIRATLVY